MSNTTADTTTSADASVPDTTVPDTTVPDTTAPAGTGSTTDIATGAQDAPAHHHGYISDKSRYLARLKRIEGQARGIHRMVDEEQYCIDVLTQISAMTSALEGVALGLLDDHLRHCVVDAARTDDEQAEAKITEATAAIRRLIRS